MKLLENCIVQSSESYLETQRSSKSIWFPDTVKFLLAQHISLLEQDVSFSPEQGADYEGAVLRFRQSQLRTYG